MLYGCLGAWRLNLFGEMWEDAEETALFLPFLTRYALAQFRGKATSFPSKFEVSLNGRINKVLSLRS
jgi:hypothetical protein